MIYLATIRLLVWFTCFGEFDLGIVVWFAGGLFWGMSGLFQLLVC